MSLDTLLRSTGTLKRKVQPVSQDASGGMRMVFETILDDVPCDAQAVTATIRMQYMAMQLAVSHKIFFNQDVAAKAGDILVINGRNFHLKGYVPQSVGYESDDWPSEMLAEDQR